MNVLIIIGIVAAGSITTTASHQRRLYNTAYAALPVFLYRCRMLWMQRNILLWTGATLLLL